MLKSLLFLFAAMISIQSGASLAKQLFPVLGVAGTTTLRIGFAAILLALLWRPWTKKFARSDILSVLPYGAALGAMNLLFYLALQRIPLGIAVAVEFAGPLAVALSSSRKKMDWLWAILAAGGMILILPQNQMSAPLDRLGLFFALAAGGCWALYILFGQRISPQLHGGLAVSLGMIIAALVTLPFGVASAGSDLLKIDILPLGVAVAVLSSALPYSLEMIALRSLPSKTFSILMSLEPAVAALSGFLFLKETLNGMQWMAIALIISASMGSSLSAQKKALPQDTDWVQ